MAAKPVELSDTKHTAVRRLCNEIQLFDLCDLERCRHKEGMFCTDQELLSRFEAIADVEERPLEARISGEDDDDGDEGFDDGYEEGYDDDFDHDDLDEDR